MDLQYPNKITWDNLFIKYKTGEKMIKNICVILASCLLSVSAMADFIYPTSGSYNLTEAKEILHNTIYGLQINESRNVLTIWRSNYNFIRNKPECVKKEIIILSPEHEEIEHTKQFGGGHEHWLLKEPLTKQNFKPLLLHLGFSEAFSDIIVEKFSAHFNESSAID